MRAYPGISPELRERQDGRAVSRPKNVSLPADSRGKRRLRGRFFGIGRETPCLTGPPLSSASRQFPGFEALSSPNSQLQCGQPEERGRAESSPPGPAGFCGIWDYTLFQNRYSITANWARVALPVGFSVPALVPPMMPPAVAHCRGSTA